MKKLSLSIIACGMVCSLWANNTLNIKSGWNLVGSELDNVNNTSFQNVKIVWGWDSTSKKWKAYSHEENLESKIQQLVEIGTFSNFSLNAGEGFWVYNLTPTTLELKGDVSNKINNILEAGWNLVSFKGKETDISKVLNNDSIRTVWTYENGKWKAWSPYEYILNIIKKELGEDSVLNKIEPNKGYWIDTQVSTVIPFELQKQVNTKELVYVYQAGSKGSNIPISNAEIYVNNNLVGKTDENGILDISSLKLPDGTAVEVVKDGYSVTTGVIQNGSVTLAISPLEAENSSEIPSTKGNARVITHKNQAVIHISKASDGNEIPLPTVATIGVDGGTVELSGTSEKSSATIYVTMFNTPSEAPMITNPIKVNGNTVLPKELSIIGGANITLRDKNGKLVQDLTKFDKSGLSYKVILDRYIGDFGAILQGLTSSTIPKEVKFNENTIKLLNKAKKDGLIDFYLLLQQKDGSYKYIDTAKFVKDPNGNWVMEPEHIDKLNEFGAGNIVYVIRTKALTGTTKVCLKVNGERMFDGTILSTPDDGKAVEGALIIPDEHVISQPAPTDANGCTTVEYKVPFLAPMYQIVATKAGFYNEPITVNIKYGHLNNSVDDNMTKKPKDASIKGYVRAKLANETPTPVANAIVALRDPQILVSDKIKFHSQEDNNSIELQADPNLDYTWILSKDDSNEKITIKQGKAKDGANILTEKDIEDVIYSENSPWVDNPYGHYYINVIVKHNYAQGEQASFTEAMTIEFDAQIDENALIRNFGYSISQGDAPVYRVDQNGTMSIVDDINTSKNPSTSKELGDAKVPIISIFGGKDLGWFEPILRPANPTGDVYTSGFTAPDHSKWITDVMSLESNTSDLCMDMNDPDNKNNPFYRYLMKLYGSKGYCVAKVTSKDVFKGQILPFSKVYSIFMHNYKDLIKKDPYNGKPFYQSGFTVVNTYYADFNRTMMNGNVYKTWVVSYTPLGEDKFKKPSDFSNVINFYAKTNEAIGFDTKVAVTNPDGSYRIDHINPAVIPSLELMARAEGTKYNTKNFRKANFPDAVYTGNLDSNVSGESDTYKELNGEVAYTPHAGDVLVHNFVLDKLADKTPISIGFENGLVDNKGNKWTVETLKVENQAVESSPDVKWQVVSNDNLPKVNEDYISEIFDNSPNAPTSILPTLYGNSYAWMGDINTGTYSDSGKMDGNKAVATALVSPVIDFSNYSLAVLKLKTWFEVSGLDAAWDTAFIGFEIVDDPDANNTTETTVTFYNGYQWKVKLHQKYIHRLTPKDPIITTYDEHKLFSNMGVNALPQWVDYEIPLNFLAGKKARIIFGFFTVDQLYNNFRGWGVDDIKIEDSVNDTLIYPPMPSMFEEGVNAEEDVNGTVIPVVETSETE